MINISDFGEKIRAERQKQGLTIETIARETKIRELYLNAIEEHDFAILPPRVYATGFVTRYARFLKMDAEALTSEFLRLAYNNDPLDELLLMREKKKTRRSLKIPWKNILASAVFLVLVLWAGNYLVAYIANWSVNRPPATHEPQSGVQPVPSENTPVADKLQMDIEARQRCWLQVKVDGVQVYSGTLAIGEKKSFEAVHTINIIAGNAGGIDLSLNQKKLAPLGQMGARVEKTYDISSIGKE